MRGRHTHGMFKMMGLEELSAKSCDEFVQKLIDMGRSKALRETTRSSLLSNKHALYEDFRFINAFDLFLKNEFVRVCD